MSTFTSPADQIELSLAQASSVNNLDAATAAAFALLPDETLLDQGRVTHAVDTGAANAYLVALPNTLAAYTDGAHVVMRPLATNTGASTINVDSLGVKSIRTNTGAALSAGDITVGVPCSMRYSTATGYFHLDSGSIASATAAAASAAAALVSENAAGVSEAAALVSENAAAASAAEFVDATTTVKGKVELATDAETVTGTDTTRAVTPANVQAKVASATAKGIVELATDAEAITGTDTSRAITAANLDAVLDDRTFNKNAIINGDFNIWQRGTSFVAPTSMQMADRFRYDKAGAMVHTVSRDTDVPTQVESGHKSNYSLKVDCTTIDAAIAVDDFINITQMVEGYNFAPFMGKTATLSFWVKAVKTGIYCVSFRNSVSDRSYIVEYTINAASTWEKKTITLTFSDSGGTWDYTNGIGLNMCWTLACGSTYQGTADTWNAANNVATSNQVNGVDSTDNNFWLAQVQLELGSVATDFEYRQFGDELARCQRYYEKSYNYDVAPATSDEGGSIQLNDPVAAGHTSVRFAVHKRVAPTTSGYSTTGASGKYRDLTSGADFDITVSDVGCSGFHVAFAASGAADELKGFHYTSDAEL